MTNEHNISRRKMLTKSLMGGLGGAFALDQLSGLNLSGDWMQKMLINPVSQRFDAFRLFPEALRGGPALLRWNEALAVDDKPWALVTIKVHDNVHTPLVFALGKDNGTVVATAALDAANHPALKKAGRATAHLEAKGVKSLSSVARLRALRFNEFFGNILQTGTYEGGVSAANVTGYVAKPFPANVAIQAALSVSRDKSIAVHQLIGTKIRIDQPDLAYFAEVNKLIKSPLGITCFMMGNEYDANGGESKNCIYSNAGRQIAVNGLSVSEYVTNLTQALGSKYVDSYDVDKNLSYKFDKLVTQQPSMRVSLLQNQQKLISQIEQLKKIALYEKETQTAAPATANLQSINAAESGAAREFLAQCQYVSTTLQIEGMPMRNFSLFLNLSDIDGRNLDSAVNPEGTFGGLTNIEGMKQLAMGLNILANSMVDAAGSITKNVIVMVVADGGRNAAMGDSDASFSIVLGPKVSGGLDDCLYAPMAMVNAADMQSTYIQDIGAQSTVAWDITNAEKGMRDSLGGQLQNVPATTGDIQVGVLEFLDDKMGLRTRTADFGNFCKLKRKA